MSLKLTTLTAMMGLSRWAAAGIIPLDGGHLRDPHVSFASSYMHFHGPVEGPEFEVKVPYVVPHGEHNHLYGHDHEDHGYTVDYVAHPKYEFSYGVEDHHSGDFHSQKESRDGSSVSGEYSVKEPGGAVRVVSYRADKDGFHAVVHTSGHNDHSGGVYGGQGHPRQAQDLGDQEEHVLQEYAAAFPAHEGYQ
ncbi:adult-specific cuticular protein ACP-22-like [Orussus abietinus]|uniref:adult-specific cuticular protein ACP-22-like n=1 Tax=Orussus abietinus TaxID=222816 RepID=UPI000625F7F1|nr:adult-specific cuticular protein ACP-22-like [Orussus abietinus]